MQPGKYTVMGHTGTLSAPPNIVSTGKLVRAQLRIATSFDRHSLLSIPISREITNTYTWRDVFTQRGLQKAPDSYISASAHGGGLAFVIPTVRLPLVSLANIEIHPKVKELSSKDELLNYILYNIIQDVNTILKNTDCEYKISIDYSEDFEDPEWTHANVIILIDDEDYDQVLDLWEEVSTKVDEYFDMLRMKTQAYPSKLAELNRLRDFINIRFISEE